MVYNYMSMLFYQNTFCLLQQHKEIVKEHTYSKLKELKVKLDGLTVEQVT